MIAVSMKMGFRLGDRGNDLSLIKRIERAGHFLGLAFQAVDDLLDATSTTEELGKEAGHDKESGKMTWVSMLGESQARELACRHTEVALSAVRDIGGDNAFLLELMDEMLNRKN